MTRPWLLSLAAATALSACTFAVPGLGGPEGADLATSGHDGAPNDRPRVDGTAGSDGAATDALAGTDAARDAGLADQAPADLATPDLATPDLATPDLATPDLATPDLATPDLATPDLLPPPDLAIVPAPTVTRVSPAYVSNAGGAQIMITGTGFLQGATVKVGGQACGAVTVVSATAITCTVPAAPSVTGATLVEVTNPDLQKGSSAALLHYYGTLAFAPAVTSMSSVKSQGLGAGDWNRDGKVDLAVADTGGSSVYSLLGNGDGTMQGPRAFASGQAPDNIEVADIDGDGKLDLVTENSQSQNPGKLVILPGNGDGTFAAPVSFNVDNWPNWVKLGSFGGVAGKDLVAGNYHTSTVSVLQKSAGNNFTYAASKSSPTAGGANVELAVADFNHDGKLDVVTTVTFAGPNDQYSVLLGNGDGTFQAPINVAAGNGAWGVVAPDLDGDGNPDIAIVNYGDSDVVVALGNGDGTFKGLTRVATLDGRGSDLTAADFNGDGIIDLAACALTSGNLDVLVNSGNGTTYAMTAVPTGVLPDVVITVDLDADGRPDLVAADGTNGGLSILLNRSM